jgi:hypothetical protein
MTYISHYPSHFLNAIIKITIIMVIMAMMSSGYEHNSLTEGRTKVIDIINVA